VFGMNTGESFQGIGRDGVYKSAEDPSGPHGGHAMLIVGYIGNYFVVKNSWGEEWGDKGYCYIPKKVLAQADADFTALILQGNKPMNDAGGDEPKKPKKKKRTKK
jgi:hypothetical protein